MPQFNNQYLGTDAYAQLDRLLSTYVSDGAMRGLLLNQIGPMLGIDKLTESTVNINGQQIAVGSSLFGPQNTAAHVNNQRNNQVIADIMQPAAQAIEKARVDFRKSTYETVWGAENENASGFSLTNMGADYLFNKSNVTRIADGVAQAARLHGTGSALPLIGNTPAYNAMVDQQERFKRLGSSVTSDYLRNQEKYGGLDGAEVGDVIDHLANTGQLQGGEYSKTQSAIRTLKKQLKENPEHQKEIDYLQTELKGMDDAMVEKLQSVSKTVGELKRVFRGSASQVLEQSSKILGTDLTASFGPESVTMARAMAVTGQLTGYSGDAMASLANISANMAQSMGADSFGAMSNANKTAQLFAASRSANMAFVNQNELKNHLQSATVGAQSSYMARDVSGAAALLESKLKADGKLSAGEIQQKLQDFSNKATALGADNRPEEVAKLLAEAGVDKATAFDIRDAGYSHRAEQLRAQGMGTDAALAQHSGILLSNRREALTRMGVDSSKFTDDQLMNVDSIVAAAGEGMSDGQRRSLEGKVRRSFNGLGGKGTAANEDAWLQSVRNDKALASFNARFEGNMSVEEQLSNYQKTDGIANLRKFITDGNKLKDQSFDSIATAIVGGDASVDGRSNISKADLPQMQKLLKAIDGEAGDAAAMQKKADLEMAVKISATGQFGNKAFDSEVRDEFVDALKSGDIAQVQKAITKHGTGDMAYQTKKDIMAAELAKADVMKKAGKKLTGKEFTDAMEKRGGTTDAEEARAAAIVSLDQIADASKLTGDKKDSAFDSLSDSDGFVKRAAEVRKLMEADKDTTMEAAVRKSFAGDDLSEDDLNTKVTDFMRTGNKLGKLSEQVEFEGGSAVNNFMESVLSLLGSMAGALHKGNPVTDPNRP